MYSDYAKIRDKKGLNDNAVARMTGISRSTFSEWKKGRFVNLKASNLEKIAALFECSIDELLGEKPMSEKYSSEIEAFLAAYLTLPANERDDINTILGNITRCIKLGISASQINIDVKIDLTKKLNI